MGVLDDLLGKDPEQRSVDFIADRTIRERLSEAQSDLDDAKRALSRVRQGDTDGKAAAERVVDDCRQVVDDLLEQARPHRIRFTFDALDAQAYDGIKGQKEHRPTEHQRTVARKANLPEPEWNTDTFPPAVISAACVGVTTPNGNQPGLSVEEARQLWASRAWNQAERGELFNAALGATVTRTRVDLPKDG